MLKPEPVKLGEVSVLKLVKGKYRFTKQDALGYYVPFIEQLTELLNMPEVQESLNADRNSDFEYSDIFDGTFFHQPYHQTKENLLLFSIYHDDFEIVNPIGSHKKKHKLSAFYWNMLNILPEYRFKVQSTQLLAMTTAKYLRKFGMAVLLENFIESMTKLHQGHNFMIKNEPKLYHGVLYFALADTPAAQFLGGFKEGVGFAEKPCRTCDISRCDIKKSRHGDQFSLRSMTEHLDRCDVIDELRGETKAYWSKMYGITSRSVLCSVPEFDVTKCILHDPMHVLFEGIVKRELQLMLTNFIDKKKYFSLNILNTIIRNFNYDETERADKPQELERRALDIKNTFPMTAIETKTFMLLLPYMIGSKVERDDKIWENFIRLLQITWLIISPVSSAEALDTLEQLISTHNHMFCELFPDVSFTPKLHYLTHFPMQIKMFGPARNHWCTRL